MQLPPGTVVGDRYLVEGPLGQGGMAVVYRVRHRSLGTLHALKLVGATSGSARQRLLREGRLQGQLQHPNVVAVTDQVEVQGVAGLVLELVDGPSLAQLLGTPLSVDQIDALGAGILAGVAAAHRIGLVHRDLKPGNVLVAVEGGRAVPKVTDFGLAVDPDADDRSTRTGATLGTPEYMAPEQVRSARDVDARADVWALGVLLYELACGALPFSDPDRFALFQQITAGAHVPLRERRPELPARMVDTVEAALQVSRDARPSDADALLARWSAEVSEARIDDLALRVMELAPSATSSGSDGTPPPALSVGATWAPPTVGAPAEVRAAVATPPPRPTDPLPEPPRPAVVPPPPSRAPWVLAAGLAVGVAVAALLVALGVAGGVLWSASRPAPTAVVVTPSAPPDGPLVVPGPDQAELETPAMRVTEPAKAKEALRDAHFVTVVDEAQWFLASSPDAPILSATGSEAIGSLYSAREEITKAARAGGPESIGEALAALLAGRTGPLDAFLAREPDDVAGHLWRTWALCPGARCREAEADVRALERVADGRGAPWYAASFQARSEGRLAEAEAALDAWAAIQPDEPMVAVERARLRVTQGRAAEVPALLAGLPEPFRRRTAWPAVLQALAALDTGDEVAYQEATSAALRQPVAARVLFARTLAPALAAHGRAAEGDDLLREAVAAAYMGDELSALLYAELQVQRAALAVERGDRKVAEDAANAVSGVAGSKMSFGWTRERAQRLALVAEGLRLVARGQRDAATRRLADLEAANPDVPDLEVLRRALAR